MTVVLAVAGVAVWLYLTWRQANRNVDAALRQAERTPTLYDWAQERRPCRDRPRKGDWKNECKS